MCGVGCVWGGVVACVTVWGGVGWDWVGMGGGCIGGAGMGGDGRGWAGVGWARGVSGERAGKRGHRVVRQSWPAGWPGHHVCGLPTMYGFPTMYLASPPCILIKGIRYHVSGW